MSEPAEDAPPPRHPPISNPLFEIWRLTRRTAAAVDAALHDEQTGSDFGLYSLLRNLGTTTTTEIADLTGSGVSTISQQLRRLEERGHLRRSPNPDDRRSTLVALTEEGRDLHAKASPGFGMLVADLVEELGEQDHAAVMYGLRRLDEALCVLLGVDLEGLSLPPLTPPSAVRSDLTPEQRREVEQFTDWVVWRDGDRG